MGIRQKFKPPPKKSIWGLGVIAAVVMVKGLTSSNQVYFYGSVIYYGIVSIQMLRLLILKVNKRQKDFKYETKQQQLAIKQVEIEIAERDWYLKINKDLSEHYFEILKADHADDQSSVRTISNVEAHSLNIILKLQERNFSNQLLRKSLEKISPEKQVTHEEL